MKKGVLFFSLVFCLLLTLPVTVLADDGFRIGFGYEDLNNELTISVPNVKLEVNSPCPMFFVEAGYDFGTSFAIDAKYGRYVEDQTLVGFDSSFIAGEIATDNNTDIFSIEGSFKKQIGLVKLAGVLGYLESDFDRALNGRILVYSAALDVERSVSGVYLGGLVSYAPNDKFEVGAAYRWMIDPDIDLRIANSSLDVTDPSSSQVEVFAQTALTDQLSLKAGYSVSWVEYDISEVNIKNKTDGLSLALSYQF